MIGPLSRDDAGVIAMNLREDDERELFATMWPEQRHASIAESFLRSSPTSWCARLDGDPVAMLAAWPMWSGVWRVGMVATDAWPRVALGVTKFVIRDMIPMLRATGAHRAEAWSIADHHEAHRWLALLGAERDAIIPRYGRNGEDFALYSWSR